MSAISGIGSIMNSMAVQDTKSRPDLAQKFKELDTDSNGGLDKTELSAIAKNLSKLTGKTADVNSAITTYDSNDDGLLNKDEMGNMIQKTMQKAIGATSHSGSSFKMQQAAKAYQAYSPEGDQLSTFLEMLDEA